MATRWKRPVLIATLALYCAGFGVLGGMLAERLRYDAERGRLVADVDRTARHVRAHMMAIERSAAGQPATASRPQIELDAGGAGSLDERHATR
jgi:hypothetical protein